MGYTNSSLVDVTIKSPNNSGTRTHKIDRITPHCVVGQLTAEGIGNCFPSGKEASCNYGIGYDGRVCLVVDEANRSWCSSSNSNDQRAVTIECASDTTSPYAFKDACYQKLIKLCIDICQRNGIKKMLWFNDKDTALNYTPADGEGVFTVHRWFASKACPGDWLMNRMSSLCAEVNKGLAETTNNVEKEEEIVTQDDFNKMMQVYLNSLAEQDATWEKDAMDWAVAEGFISGDNQGRLMPKGLLTRGQLATVLKRYSEKHG